MIRQVTFGFLISMMSSRLFRWLFVCFCVVWLCFGVADVCIQFSNLDCGDRFMFFTRTSLRYVRIFAVVIPSVVCRLSIVCNVGAPYSRGWTFRQNFFTAVYAGHPLTSVQNFTEIVPGEPLRRGVKRKRGSKIERFYTCRRYISQTVQDRRIVSI